MNKKTKENKMELIKAKKTASELMQKYNLSDWHFNFDNAKRRFGVCNHKTKTISLSKYLVELNNDDQVKDTILHEIAHALLPKGVGHSRQFYLKCVEIGATPQRCYSQSVKQPKALYKATCKNCGKEFFKYRKTITKSSCGLCSGGRYNEAFLLTYNKQ